MLSSSPKNRLFIAFLILSSYFLSILSFGADSPRDNQAIKSVKNKKIFKNLRNDDCSTYYINRIGCNEDNSLCIQTHWEWTSYDPVLLRSIDGGKTYTPTRVHNVTSEYGRITNVSCTGPANTATCLASGSIPAKDSISAIPILLKSEDGGQNWYDEHFLDQSIDVRLFATGCFGTKPNMICLTGGTIYMDAKSFNQAFLAYKLPNEKSWGYVIYDLTPFMLGFACIHHFNSEGEGDAKTYTAQGTIFSGSGWDSETSFQLISVDGAKTWKLDF